MSGADLLALLPILVVGLGIVALMLVVAFFPYHRVSVFMTLGTLVAALLVIPLAMRAGWREVTPLLVIDPLAVFFFVLLLGASVVVTLLSYDYLEGREGHRNELYHGEFYLLLLLAVLGALVLVASRHFAALFIGLETLSVSLFALIAYPVRLRHPIEAGVKYLILSGVSSAFLFFGMALVYAETGSMVFTDIAMVRTADVLLYLLAGFALIGVGVAFKLSLAPFHLWTPDIYEGAPAPVAGFISTVSKGAVVALLLRLLIDARVHEYETLLAAFTVLAILSMLAGNLLALLQTNVKRLLGYSSVAHMGYLLVALLVLGPLGLAATGYYLVGYFVTMLGAFGVISALSVARPERDMDQLQEYRGLFWKRPWLAGLFSAILLSLAGIPLTVGFIAKFYALAAGIDGGYWALVWSLVVGSAIGLYYYLRVMVVMFAPAEEVQPIVGEATQAGAGQTPTLFSGIALVSAAVLLIWLGLFPMPLIGLIGSIATLG